MRATNGFAPAQKKTSLTTQLQSDVIQGMMMKSLHNKESVMRLTSTLIEAVNSSEQLKACTAPSIVSAALRGEGMGLIFGHGYYLVPYGTKATYITSYKGYIQLAMSTGYYNDIDVIDIRKGEYERRNPRTGKPEFNFDFYEDDDAREAAPIIGFYGYFELKDGTFRGEYWSMPKLLKHADRFSAAFKKDKWDKAVEAFKQSGGTDSSELDRLAKGSPWYDMNGGQEKMCRKTVLRSLLNGGYAPLSNGVKNFINNDGEEPVDTTPVANMNFGADASVNPDTGEVIEGSGVVVEEDVSPVAEAPTVNAEPVPTAEAPKTKRAATTPKAKGNETVASGQNEGDFAASFFDGEVK